MKKFNKSRIEQNTLCWFETKNNGNLNRFKNRLLTFLLLSIVAFSLSSATKENATSTKNFSSTMRGEREAFDELIGLMAKGDQLEIMVSSVSVKKHGGIEHSFTGFGTGKVKKENDYVRTELSGIRTSFSDRNRFNGVTTVEHIYLSFSGNRFKIKVRFQTWGGQTIELKAPTLEKREQGFFATGNYRNGRRTFYYTIALHESPYNSSIDIEPQFVISG